jgi:transcriptional regulator with XRE-family HTH domain
MGSSQGARLREERKKRGWDISRMVRELRRSAESLGVDITQHSNLVDYVGRWERGAVGVSERYRVLYARAFGVSEDTLFECPPPAPTAQQPDVLRLAWMAGRLDRPVDRQVIRHLADALDDDPALAATTVDPAVRLYRALDEGPAGPSEDMISYLEARSLGFHQLQAALPNDTIFRPLLAHLGEITSLLEVCPAGSLRRRLASTAGESAALAAWLAEVLTEAGLAEELYGVAHRAAREAGDPAPIACANIFHAVGERLNARRVLTHARRLYPRVTGSDD